MKQYIIVSYKNQYKLYDVLRNLINKEIKIKKDNSVYLEHTYGVIDRGMFIKLEKRKKYLGELIFKTGDLLELINKYNELVKEKE